MLAPAGAACELECELELEPLLSRDRRWLCV